jgi:hypothetical protein
LLNQIAAIHGTGVAASTTSYESISTVTITGATTGNQVNTIEFTSIPSTYKHLQIRGIYRDTWTAGGVGESYIEFNGDSSASYSYHYLWGTGSAAAAGGGGSVTNGWAGFGARGGSISNTFGGFVIDILDYANTNKYKTVRTLGGADLNGSGTVALMSASWQKTNAVSSIKFYANGYGFAQYSSFALYGIKG